MATRPVAVHVVLPASSLARSPSLEDGVAPDVERLHRSFGCELIQEAGVLLRLPQVVMATAQTLLQRFYYRKSLRQFDAFRVAVSCLFLAAKVEEKPKRIKDVIGVFYAMFRRRKWQRSTVAQQLVDLDGATFSQWRMWLIMVERQVLIDLGFSIYSVTEHPHKYVLYYVKVLDGSSALAQQAWGYINDSQRTDLCVRYKSQVIACAAIFLASRFQGVALPENPPWYSLFDVDKKQLYAVSVVIVELYKQEKIQWLEPLTETNPFAVDDHPMEEEEEVQEPMQETAVDGKIDLEKEISPQEPSSFASVETSTPASAKSSQEVKTSSNSSAKASERRSRWDDGLAKSRRGRSRSPDSCSRRSRSESRERRRDTSRSRRQRSRSRSADRGHLVTSVENNRNLPSSTTEMPNFRAIFCRRCAIVNFLSTIAIAGAALEPATEKMKFIRLLVSLGK
ncbi:hypothetical protein PC117_g445 [Phytophthora cactorum]|uniref:Cyclin-like domain-containing protein n=1 Tax=Phytophthora cactorum TaxID=29920 RepID=A0A8T1EKR2_9STRA|nr:hypothetical protein PC117_g445 [Phytophthora cactorum]